MGQRRDYDIKSGDGDNGFITPLENLEKKRTQSHVIAFFIYIMSKVSRQHVETKLLQVFSGFIWFVFVLVYFVLFHVTCFLTQTKCDKS